MPRIAHVISTPEGIGGAERIVAALVEGGSARGWDQVVLNPFASDPSRSELAQLCAPAIYRGHRCANLAQVPGVLMWLRRELAASAPDIVHAHLFHASVAVAAVRRRGGAKYVLTHHHGDHFVFAGRRFDALIDRLAGRRYDRVVAISRWVQEFLVSTYSYTPERVVFIPNGWAGDPQPDCGLGNKPTVICVAGFRREKGHADLLAAFALVRKQVPDARLILLGDGKLGPELRSRASALGILESVKFRGSTSDVWPYLAEAHVFALASLNEAHGIAVLEAMAASLPVVATRVGGIPELVEPGTTGQLVAPHAPAEMSRVLVELLRSDEARKRLGVAARERASGFTTEATTDRYFDLYRDLAGWPESRSIT